MTNIEVMETINNLTNSYYAGLAFIATVVFGVMAFVFWDRMSFKKSVEKEFQIMLKKELRNQKLEIDYYYLKHLPFIDMLRKRYRGMGVSSEKMIRYELKFAHFPLERLIEIYDESLNNAFQPYFENYSRTYYEICNKIIEDSRSYSIHQKDTLTDLELDSIKRVNKHIIKINYIFSKYGYLEFEPIHLD